MAGPCLRHQHWKNLRKVTVEENVAWKWRARMERINSISGVIGFFLTLPKGRADSGAWIRNEGTMLEEVMGSGNVKWQANMSRHPPNDGKNVWVMDRNGILEFRFNGKESDRDIQKEYGEFGLNGVTRRSPLRSKTRFIARRTDEGPTIPVRDAN